MSDATNEELLMRADVALAEFVDRGNSRLSVALSHVRMELNHLRALRHRRDQIAVRDEDDSYASVDSLSTGRDQ